MRKMPQMPHSPSADGLSDEETKRSFVGRLVGNLVVIGAGTALVGLIFYLLWFWQGDAVAPVDAYRSSSERIKAETVKRDAQKAAEAAKSKADENVQILLQGPKAGQLVAPPRRNVTPGFQLSPFNQATPLIREEGIPIPPEPEPEPLPDVFRKVLVTSPTRLSLVVSKYRKEDVNLAHLQPVSSDLDCWIGGRAVKCEKLGATSLQRFIRRRAVRCDWIGEEGVTNDEKAKAGSSEAVCYLGPGIRDFKAGEEPKNVTDLASYLVQFGWAEPEEGFYQDELFEAKQAKRGLFATKGSSASGDILERQQESREVSDILSQTTKTITPSDGTSLLSGKRADALTIMEPPSSEPEEEKELPLPPGFELR
ncbi:hypothetical protein [uncultured Cohaesibacter sp.]|uniref:hypothetical protein n=1 Tax=uncultured Cohaesibacter sp. TaxID=1002546 RepID=UPI00292D9683|nr:hypothetical protein [uncultured Cohaesibacter sp.]